MDAAFELIKSDLADDGVDHVFHLAGQQRLALFRRGGREELFERQHFAENGRRFSQRQGRSGQKLPLPRRQYLMDAMAQFMREGHHVPRFAEIVQHHVRMRIRHRRVGEGAGGLSGL